MALPARACLLHGQQARRIRGVSSPPNANKGPLSRAKGLGKARESVFNGVTLKVPKELAGILPAGSSDFEVHSYLGLKHSLREGDEALDIGCSYGVMSALMGRLVGSSGRVHSLEANAEVAPMAQLLLRENGGEPCQ